MSRPHSHFIPLIPQLPLPWFRLHLKSPVGEEKGKCVELIELLLSGLPGNHTFHTMSGDASSHGNRKAALVQRYFDRASSHLHVCEKLGKLQKTRQKIGGVLFKYKWAFATVATHLAFRAVSFGQIVLILSTYYQGKQMASPTGCLVCTHWSQYYWARLIWHLEDPLPRHVLMKHSAQREQKLN